MQSSYQQSTARSGEWRGDHEDAAKIIYVLGSHLISHPPAQKKINNDGGDDLDATK
jgi:hypothetical protein